MILRHKVWLAVRTLRRKALPLDRTPILTTSTPEGARDYLVPTACTPGVLRAAAVAADSSRDPDIAGMDATSRSRSVSRRGPARRSPAGVHAGRLEISFATENLVFSILEPLMGPVDALIGRDAAAAIPADAVLRSDRALRDRTSPICGPAWSWWICRRRSRRQFLLFRGCDRACGDVRGSS